MSDQRRLRRLSLVWQKQPVYFVTTCVADRRRLLARSDIHIILQEEWAGWHERHGWAVGRYVVMPDHVHWLVQLNEGARLGEVVRRFKARVSLQLGTSVWQRGFYDHALRKDEDLVPVARYVVANPVRAGLVPRVGDYPHWDAVWLDS